MTKIRPTDQQQAFIAALLDPAAGHLYWQRAQEQNLAYVAYTRAQHSLVFVG